MLLNVIYDFFLFVGILKNILNSNGYYEVVEVRFNFSGIYFFNLLFKIIFYCCFWSEEDKNCFVFVYNVEGKVFVLIVNFLVF